jgi:dUTP pyrophosphatase
VALSVPLRPLKPGLTLPAYATVGSAGLDLAAALDEPIEIAPGGFVPIPCGFAVAIPEGFEGQIRPRSGLAARHGLTVLNTPGTIDSDYRGEVKVILINHGPAPVTITHGMRIAQLVVAPVTRVEWMATTALPETDRGSGGFGHTGT